jgi:hypothetical protein
MEMLPEIFSQMRDWVLADEAYPRKLLQEIKSFEQKKEEISESHRRLVNRAANPFGISCPHFNIVFS